MKQLQTNASDVLRWAHIQRIFPGSSKKLFRYEPTFTWKKILVFGEHSVARRQNSTSADWKSYVIGTKFKLMKLWGRLLFEKINLMVFGKKCVCPAFHRMICQWIWWKIPNKVILYAFCAKKISAYNKAHLIT